jgi:hypothetical protein
MSVVINTIHSSLLLCSVETAESRAMLCVTLFVVVSITQNGGMTIWQHGIICIEKIDVVEVEEKWLLCPGKVIFEHPTKLTNNACYGWQSCVVRLTARNKDRLENSIIMYV